MYFQRAIPFIKELKHLEMLNIEIKKLSTKSIRAAVCFGKRENLKKVCLPKIKLKKIFFQKLLTKAPNLTFLCLSHDNKDSIDVSNLFVLFLLFVFVFSPFFFVFFV